MLFTYNIGGLPTLNLIPLEHIEDGKFYLSSGQTAIAYRDRGTDTVTLYQLQSGKIDLYDSSCMYELKEDNPDCAMFFPAETVKIAMRLEIMGGGVE